MARADELTVRVGHRVATEAMAVHRQSLERFAEQLRRAGHELARLDGFGEHPAVHAVAEARAHVARATQSAETAVEALRRAEEGYATADASVLLAMRTAGGAVAWLAGLLWPLTVLFLAPALLPAAAHAGLQFLRGPEHFGALLEAHRRFLNTPLAVELVRSLVMGADDTVNGVLRVPLPLAQLLGERGLGISGVASSAGLLIAAAGGAGMLREAPARVTSTVTSTATPPRGLAERVDRIPRDGRHQVRVERSDDAQGSPRFEVYIGGTIDPSLVAGREVLDMTSNAHAVAEQSPASLRGVREALSRAGVGAGDPVTITGYSQGALVGALLAASGEYRVDALIEVGAPSGQVRVPDEVSRVRLEHTSDVVTALGGDVTGAGTIRVQRDPLIAGLPEGGPVFAAHDLSLYRDTAELADRSPDGRLRAAIRDVDAPLTGATEGTSTLSRAERRPLTASR